MGKCYADDAHLTDEVFVNLNAHHTRAMWKMLVERGKDLQLTYDSVQADDLQGQATWVAEYTFSATGRHVMNRIQAQFEFRDGLILNHRDHFDFFAWSRQALGWKGAVLGWSAWLRSRVKAQAMRALERYIAG